MNKEVKDATKVGQKVLTIYFSHSGNTKCIAEHINKQVGGDIVEILVLDPYATLSHTLHFIGNYNRSKKYQN